MISFAKYDATFVDDPRRRPPFVVGLLAVALSGQGCAAISGTDGDFRTDAVEGWEGPLLITVGTDMPTACPDGFVDERIYRRGLMPIEDNCECSVPASACETRVTVHAADDDTCANEGPVTVLAPDVCVGIAAGGQRLKATLAGERRCEAATALLEPRFEESMRVCRCSGDCPAPPPSAMTCVRLAGDVSCPADTDYVDRHLVFEDVDDTRACDCGDALCDGRLRWHDSVPPYSPSEACEVGLPTDPPTDLDGCSDVVNDSDDILVKFALRETACSRSGAEALSGEVRLANPVTVCCLP